MPAAWSSSPSVSFQRNKMFLVVLTRGPIHRGFRNCMKVSSLMVPSVHLVHRSYVDWRVASTRATEACVPSADGLTTYTGTRTACWRTPRWTCVRYCWGYCYSIFNLKFDNRSSMSIFLIYSAITSILIREVDLIFAPCCTVCTFSFICRNGRKGDERCYCRVSESRWATYWLSTAVTLSQSFNLHVVHVVGLHCN